MSQPVFNIRALLGFLFLCTSHTVYAQSPRQAAVSFSYFGEFIGHPGFKAGIETPLAGAYKPGKRHGLLLLGANLSAYRHRGNHTGLFVDTEIGYRFITRGGFKAEMFLGAGYHRSYIDGPVYTVNELNEVKRDRFAGQNTILLLWSFGLGKQMKRSPVAWHIRPGLMVRTPHNSAILPHLFIETGVTYRLNNQR